MSKSITSGLKSHIASEVTTIAWCLKITRLDGETFCFTDHDVDLVIDGYTYEASSGMIPSTLKQSNNASVDNMEMTAFIQSTKISEADISAGKFDYALVDLFFVNYTDYESLQVS